MYRFDYPPFCWPLCFLTSRGCTLNSIKKINQAHKFFASTPSPPPQKNWPITFAILATNSNIQAILAINASISSEMKDNNHNFWFLMERLQRPLLLRAKSGLGFVPLTVNMTPNYFQRKKDPINYITDWGSLILCLLVVLTKATWNLSDKYPVYLNIKILHNVIYIVWLTNGISSI